MEANAKNLRNKMQSLCDDTGDCWKGREEGLIFVSLRRKEESCREDKIAVAT